MRRMCLGLFCLCECANEKNLLLAAICFSISVLAVVSESGVLTDLSRSPRLQLYHWPRERRHHSSTLTTTCALPDSHPVLIEVLSPSATKYVSSVRGRHSNISLAGSPKRSNEKQCLTDIV